MTLKSRIVDFIVLYQYIYSYGLLYSLHELSWRKGLELHSPSPKLTTGLLCIYNSAAWTHVYGLGVRLTNRSHLNSHGYRCDIAIAMQLIALIVFCTECNKLCSYRYIASYG